MDTVGGPIKIANNLGKFVYRTCFDLWRESTKPKDIIRIFSGEKKVHRGGRTHAGKSRFSHLFAKLKVDLKILKTQSLVVSLTPSFLWNFKLNTFSIALVWNFCDFWTSGGKLDRRLSQAWLSNLRQNTFINISYEDTYDDSYLRCYIK